MNNKKLYSAQLNQTIDIGFGLGPTVQFVITNPFSDGSFLLKKLIWDLQLFRDADNYRVPLEMAAGIDYYMRVRDHQPNINIAGPIATGFGGPMIALSGRNIELYKPGLYTFDGLTFSTGCMFLVELQNSTLDLYRCRLSIYAETLQV